MNNDITTGEVTSIRSENVTVSEVPAEIKYTEFDATVYAYLTIKGPKSPSEMWMDGMSDGYGSINEFLAALHKSVSKNVAQYTGGGSIYDAMVPGKWHENSISAFEVGKGNTDEFDSMVRDGSMKDTLFLIGAINEDLRKKTEQKKIEVQNET